MNVRFCGRYWGQRRHALLHRTCLLLTQSEHSVVRDLTSNKVRSEPALISFGGDACPLLAQSEHSSHTAECPRGPPNAPRVSLNWSVDVFVSPSLFPVIHRVNHKQSRDLFFAVMKGLIPEERYGSKTA
jgi:hypothetical protein